MATQIFVLHLFYNDTVVLKSCRPLHEVIPQNYSERFFARQVNPWSVVLLLLTATGATLPEKMFHHFIFTGESKWGNAWTIKRAGNKKLTRAYANPPAFIDGDQFPGKKRRDNHKDHTASNTWA